MKLVMLFLLMNFAYGQTPSENVQSETEREESTKNIQKQEEAQTGPIENPFLVGPYKGNEYIPFDRLRLEKEQAEEEKRGP